jgi:WD40 repeat protein
LVALAAAAALSATPRTLRASTASGVSLVIQHGLGEACLHTQLSLNGHFAACTLGATRRVVVWEVASGTLLREFASADAPLALSPTGTMLALRRTVGPDARVVELHDLDGGRLQATYENAGFLGAAAFSPDGRHLAYDAEGRSVVVRSIADGRVVTTLPDRGKPLVFVGPTALLTWPALEAKRRLWPEVSALTPGRAVELDVSTLRKKCAPGCQPASPYRVIASPSGRHVIGMFASVDSPVDDREVWWDTASGRVSRTTRYGLSPVAAVSDDGREAWTVRRGKLLHVSDGGVRALADIPGVTEVMSRDGQRLLVSPDWRVPLGSRNPKTGTVWNVPRGTIVSTYREGVAEMRDVAVAARGTHLATVADGAHVWDLASLASLRYLPIVGASKIAISEGGEAAAVYRGDGMPYASLVWSVATGALLGTFPRAPGPVAPHVRDLWLTAGGRELSTWDTALTRRVVLSGATSLEANPDQGTRDSGVFAATDSWFYVATQSPSERTIFRVRQSDGGALTTVASGIRVVPVRPGVLSQSRRLAVSRDNRIAVLSDQGNLGHLVVWDLGTNSLIREISGPSAFEALALSDDGEHLAAGDGVGNVHAWKTRAGGEIATFKHPGSVRRVAFVAGQPLIASAGTDDVVKLSSLATRQSVSLLTDGPEWFAFTDDGYFGASKDGGRGIAAVRGLQSYAVDQLAVRLNRPDRVLERIGLGSPELLEHYRAMYARRLRRLGLRPEDVEGRLEQAPTVHIVSAETKDGAMTVKAELEAASGELSRYNVYVNGVPQLGTTGKALAGGAGAHATVTERVMLVNGPNHVEVSAMNRAGAESLREGRTVAFEGGPAPEIYYLGFGVSRYRDSRFDLAYAHKDVLDVAHYVRNVSKGFAKTHVQTYVDEQVTKQAITNAKKFLESATVADTVVVFVAGHGTWSRGPTSDYYFLTHDFDLGDIEQSAASFSLIEDLLQDVRPQRKLLLIDTCESGERDPQATDATRAEAGARGLQARSARALVLAKSGPRPAPRRYLFDRQRYIYNDLSRRSGAIVLSSSQGSELSYERDELQNGVFTEHVLRALTSGIADTNKDGIVSDRELRAHVSEAVAKDTGGLQHPSVDRDNPSTSIGFPVVAGLAFPTSYPRSSSKTPAPAAAPAAAAPSPQPVRPGRGCGCDAGAGAGTSAPGILVLITLAGLRRRRHSAGGAGK